MTLLDPHIARFIAAVDAAPYPPIHENTVDGARAGLRALVAGAERPPLAQVAETAVAGLPARIYRGEHTGAVPTVLFFHGGGFVIGDLETHDRFCRRLCIELGAVVVSVAYRLAPENAFPAAAQDAVAALADTADRLSEYGGDKLVVAGDSAGGNLAIVATQAIPGAAAAQLLIYPATDTFGAYSSRVANAAGYYLESATLRWFAERYIPVGTDPHDPRHSPLRAAPEVIATQPPTLIVTAEFDPLRDEAEAYAGALREAGVPVHAHRYPGLVHGFIDLGAVSPAAEDALQDLFDRAHALLAACA
ncbi:alpha/beta hydrolase [Gordonia sp. VNK21]|uniref:alpha/beta hydrolase n=1 Tax=Gordonia sp. VNK21 TaxID=3382483 RepID=UPI0038D47BD2